MNNNILMMYLQLAFINYNEYAFRRGMFSFFTREVNGQIELYSIPDYKEFRIPQSLPKILRYIHRTEENNVFSLDVMGDLNVLLKRIRKEGLTDYPKKFVNSLNIENGSVLADTIIPDETTKYYRVVNSRENKIQLIEIENRKGRPIFSAFKSKPFDANIEHNAIFINGRLLTRYKHQRG